MQVSLARLFALFFILYFGFSSPVNSQSMAVQPTPQHIISLPFSSTHSLPYPTPERQYRSDLWGSQLISNISEPALMVFEPKAEKRNGAAVILAPGGGLYVLSVMGEGVQVAEWLVDKGFTVFILKYRLVPTTGDGAAEISKLLASNSSELFDKVGEVLPFSIQDGIEAMRHVRGHATEYGIDPNRIGMMGFSAGGAVAMGVMYESEPEDHPDFFVPVYSWTTVYPVQEAPLNAPPMLVICATDDGLDLAKGSVELYQSWLQTGASAGLIMYSKGGHGFGMRKQGLPSDDWIERVYEWIVSENMVADKPE